MKRSKLSKRASTRWDELMTVRQGECGIIYAQEINMINGMNLIFEKGRLH